MRIARAALLGLALVSALASQRAVEGYDDDRASLIATAGPGLDDDRPGVAPDFAWAAILPVAPAPTEAPRVVVASTPAPANAPPRPAPLRFAPKTSPPRT